jgi:membrane protease YdiL (CAAX protease family)
MADYDQPAVAPFGAPGETPKDEDPPWGMSTALLALLMALAASVVGAFIIASFFLATGTESPDDSSAFTFVATALQSVVFVVVALGVAGQQGKVTLQQFGFRRFDWTAIGWAVVAIVAYFVLAAIYVQLANPPEDDVPRQFGADQSTALAILTGVFVIAVAPPVEEFFFRGFLFQSFRNRLGVLGGAALSGLLFGAIHFKPDFLVPLAILGTTLALLFQKTGSLWPCIMVHALNNAIAFSVTV